MFPSTNIRHQKASVKRIDPEPILYQTCSQGNLGTYTERSREEVFPMYQTYAPYRSYPYYREYQGDQRFFPFFGLPFLAGGLAGLAISPLLFNRPCYGPGPCYPPPYPGPGYGPYPYPQGPVPYGNNIQSSPYNFTENINIYPQR